MFRLHKLLGLCCEIGVCFLLCYFASAVAYADFTEYERLLSAPAAEFAEKVDVKRVVVAVRDTASAQRRWDVAQAAGVELTAALRRHDVDAIRAAADARWNELESATHPFTARETRVLEESDREALIGVEWLSGKKKLKIVALSPKSSKSLWTKVVDVPEAAMSQERNIPPLNRSVLEFSKANFGKPVRDGDCTRLADDALKAAGVGRRGTYRWGRELGPKEPWLPGDIVQMERSEVKGAAFSRTFAHHTAVIEEVRPSELVILHQNAFPRGKEVQRETWPIAGISGEVVAYRPWDWPKVAPLPPACPLRVTTPLIVGDASSSKVDLLKLVDPRLDRIQGIWFFENGGLQSHCEFVARLQFPVVPPKSYSLRLAVERLEGDEAFGIGIVVAGRQTMLAIDGWKATATGLHNLDGKWGNENESTKSGTFLPLAKRAEIECRVRDNHIVLEIDKVTVIDWRGDPMRLSLAADWAVPHSDWLFIACHNSVFRVSAFTLDPLK